MQLPRGTLHSVKKDIQPSILFKEISGQKFTGHCNIYLNSGNASIVFREGRCILAKTGQFCGFDAYKRIEKDPSSVSAELYTFTETQIGLSTEFNVDCTVVFPKKNPLPIKKEEKEIVPDSKIMAEVKRQQLSEDSIRPDSTKDINTLFEFRPAVNPKIRKPKSDFQLPRGKFVAIQKSVPLLNIINFAEEKNFSGYMVIDIGVRKASIIYRNGMCIMIDYPPKYGEEATRDIQKDFGKKVTAELYDLSHQQMDLALEFNDGYWANTWTKGTGVSIRSLSKEIIEDNQNHFDENTEEDVGEPNSKREDKNSGAPEQTSITEISKHGVEITDIPDDDELDEFAKQVNTLENMDMELMESRVRDNFRDVIKELDLEYLINDRKAKKNGPET
ncbi:hypothetical protein L1S32_01430 [Methanogenium sp. S4BF]|uniref:hypothetical protein n=1 Tax=Methanogenium sp. S4BF TaxID=1789226 RepID=UPI0024159B9E|nr:hypothetical protein [Methanogenium sp. S4BF]WFN34811.1 hypothetical protein L1S32_01430 [Methanogenium sp. S4BF]